MMMIIIIIIIGSTIKINCLGTGAEIKAPKAQSSEMLKVSRGVEWGGVSPTPTDYRHDTFVILLH